MATSAPEALKLHHQVANEAWRTAMKGQVASEYLQGLLKSTPKPDRILAVSVSTSKHNIALKAESPPKRKPSMSRGINT